jgi:arginine-tRNA-protein transferase
MKLLSEPQVSTESPCPYIEGRRWCFSYFFALDVAAEELEIILSRGWRKFGMYYFKPVCRECRECIPIRVITAELIPSKSQRRVLKECRDVRVEFKDMEYRDEIFEIYKDHSLNRFNKESDEDDFRSSFYTRSCPAIQSEYFIGDTLAAVGFLDVSSDGLSSIYFIYKNEFTGYSLGTFSALKESEYARSLGLKYYYLGFYIRDNPSMAYKNNFHINEKMNLDTGDWLREDCAIHIQHKQEQPD